MSEITVVSRTQRILAHTPSTVTVVNAGPQGPQGLGGSAASYEHIQTVVSNSWVFNHNLGFKPSIDVYDIFGNEIDAHVIHHTVNQAEVQLLNPRAGSARAS